MPELEPTPEPTPTPKEQGGHSRQGLFRLLEPQMLPEEAQFDILTFMGGYSPYGQPNSFGYSPNGLLKRFFGPDGRAKLDIDLSNHGNSKEHPDVPHKHRWRWDKDGKSHRDEKGKPLDENDYDLLNEEDKKKLEKYNESLCWLAVPFGVAAANYCSSAWMNKSSLNIASSGGSSGMVFFFNGCGGDYFAYGIR